MSSTAIGVPRAARGLGRGGADAALDLGDPRVVDRTHIDAQRDAAGNAVRLIRFDLDPADGRDGFADLERGAFNRQHDLAGGA